MKPFDQPVLHFKSFHVKKGGNNCKLLFGALIGSFINNHAEKATTQQRNQFLQIVKPEDLTDNVRRLLFSKLDISQCGVVWEKGAKQFNHVLRKRQRKKCCAMNAHNFTSIVVVASAVVTWLIIWRSELVACRRRFNLFLVLFTIYFMLFYTSF